MIKQIISCCGLFCETVCVRMSILFVIIRDNVMSCVLVVIKDKITLCPQNGRWLLWIYVTKLWPIIKVLYLRWFSHLICDGDRDSKWPVISFIVHFNEVVCHHKNEDPRWCHENKSHGLNPFQHPSLPQAVSLSPTAAFYVQWCKCCYSSILIVITFIRHDAHL